MESSKPPTSAAPTTTSARRKKEVFQWSTPADEFAEDVGSDVEDEKISPDDLVLAGSGGEEEDVGLEEEEDPGSESDDDPLRHDMPLEDEDDDDAETGEDERRKMKKKRGKAPKGTCASGVGSSSFPVDSETGGLIINLGVEDADKFSAIEALGAKKQRRRKTPLSDGTGNASLPRGKHKYPCPKCNKEWSWPWELRRHIVTHYREKERQETSAYKCETCMKGFQWKRDLAQHRRLHTGEKLLICSVCEKKFTTRQALLHHVVVHTGEKPFQCAFCGNKFTQPANLRTHMKKKHNDLNVRGNKCPHCSEGFTSIVAVHQHVLDDHQNLVAEARESIELERIRKEAERMRLEREKMERRKQRIKEKVMSIAQGDRPYKRVKEWEMEYEFQLGEGLVRGVDWDRTPSNGELSCDQCERKFGWRYEVMFHGLCHLVDEEGNAKNKVCPECDTAFKVPIGLKHHLVHHTGETPFLCLHCWKSFSSHIDLKLHIRKEHLLHLLPTSKQGTKTKYVSTPKVSVKKMEEDSKKELVFAQEDDGSTAESVTVVVEEDGSREAANGGTIMIGGGGDQNDQDMIVIVQSGEFEDSQGLIVVDPSQIRQINGEEGQGMKLSEVAGEEEEDGTTTTVVVSQEETSQDDEGDESTYVVVDSNNQITIQSSKRRTPHGIVPEENHKKTRRRSPLVEEEEIIISSDTVEEREDGNIHTETIIEDSKVAIIQEKNDDDDDEE
eukprot:TRINITY_DN8099_c0_g1_i1.p1 TRINITY_DN8099_c0_g1~~TRINITY_DN8099_c0_g1_i1.p1  ORF type:complete len:726 (-),score=270.96 TRINITY_DN8099_c0_g1_i1:130-2307(-)